LAYLVVFSVYLGWIVAAVGLGSALARLLGFSADSDNSLLKHEVRIAVWGFLGLAGFSTIAVATNFFWPVDGNVSSICVLLGATLFLLNCRQIVSWIHGSDKAILVVLLFYVSLIPMTPVECYDTGLYHLQSIKWINQSPVPLGLANLHYRFGFNSSWFPLASLIELPALKAHSPNFLSNSIAMFFYGSAIFLAAARCFSNDWSLSRLFLALTAIPWARKIDNCMNAPSPDLPIMLMTFLIIYLITDYWEGGRSKVAVLQMAAVLCAFAVTVKMSIAPLLPCIFVLFFDRGWQGTSGRDESSSDFRTRYQLLGGTFSRRVTLAIFLLLVLWAARGLCLSGCLFFPSRVACLNHAEWTVSEHRAKFARDWITGWARQPGPNGLDTLSNWNWLTPWLKRHVVREKVMLSLLFFGIVFSLAAALKNHRPDPPVPSVMIPALICFLGIIFWFITAPDPRFGYGVLFSFAILIFCQGVLRISSLDIFDSALTRCGNWAWPAALGIGCFLIVLSITGNVGSGALWGIVALFFSAIFRRSGPAKTFVFWIVLMVLLLNAKPLQRALQMENWNQWSSFRQETISVHTTDSGLSVYVPENDCCWDAPLPCTPEFVRKIEASRAQDGNFIEFWLPEK